MHLVQVFTWSLVRTPYSFFFFYKGVRVSHYTSPPKQIMPRLLAFRWSSNIMNYVTIMTKPRQPSRRATNRWLDVNYWRKQRKQGVWFDRVHLPAINNSAGWSAGNLRSSKTLALLLQAPCSFGIGTSWHSHSSPERILMSRQRSSVTRIVFPVVFSLPTNRKSYSFV